MKIKKHTPDSDGWSEWVQPRHAKYLMQCCDCGLVHEMQFRVVKDEGKQVDVDATAPGRVVFRARRNAKLGAKLAGTEE